MKRFGDRYFTSAPVELDALASDEAYVRLPAATRLLLLYDALMLAVDKHEPLRRLVDELRDELRVLPVGEDRQGRYYWHFGDARIYREEAIKYVGRRRPESPAWSIVVRTLDEWETFLAPFRGSAHEGEADMVELLGDETMPAMVAQAIAQQRAEARAERLANVAPRGQSVRARKLAEKRTRELEEARQASAAREAERQRKLAARAAQQAPPVVDQWVQCSTCRKWRRVAATAAAALAAQPADTAWHCADNTWDARFALCSAPEEDEHRAPTVAAHLTPLGPTPRVRRASHSMSTRATRTTTASPSASLSALSPASSPGIQSSLYNSPPFAHSAPASTLKRARSPSRSPPHKRRNFTV